MSTVRKIVLAALILVLCPSTLLGTERISRIGVGFSNQLKNGIPAVSFKKQSSKSFSLGGIFALSTNDSGGGYGAGLKVYRNLFDEPNLNFYASVMGAIISSREESKETAEKTKHSGFQLDLSFGSEFNFAGLRSLGFSFEFGLSVNELEDMVFETVGDSYIVSGVHFYL